MSWYKAGTVSLTAGSKVVTGAGTDFIKNVEVGFVFYGPNNVAHEVESITSASVLGLVKVYAGPTASGQTYGIAQTQGIIAELSGRAATLLDGVQTIVDAQSGALASAAEADAAAATAVASAAAALASKNAAATSASGADTSEANADASAIAAAAARTAAEAALDAFDDRFLGAKAVAPTVDNDGGALIQGALYWDTVLQAMRVRGTSAWVTLPAATAASTAFTPAGGIAATNVQAALAELDTDKAPKASPTFTGAATMNGGMLVEAVSTAVPSAATTNIWALTGNTIHVTGNVTITSFGTAPQAGARKWVIFDGTPLLTQAANLNLNGAGLNVQIAAGDIAMVCADTTTQLDVFVIRKSGQTVPLAPAFSALGDVSSATLVPGTFVKVGYTTVEYDYDSSYSLSRFTAKVAGVYAFEAAIVCPTSGLLSFYKNGVRAKDGPGTGAVHEFWHASAHMLLGVGDFVEAFGYNSGSVSVNTSPSSAGAYFQGALIRRT